MDIRERLENIPTHMLNEIKKIMNDEGAFNELKELVQRHPISIDNEWTNHSLSIQDEEELDLTKQILCQTM